MTPLHRISRRSSNVARIAAALFALLWLSVIAAPCAMAMQAHDGQPAHDCPHCPPAPCEAKAENCDPADDLNLPRAGDQTQTFAMPADDVPLFEHRDRPPVVFTHLRPLARAGPRAHLLHAQFNE